MGRSGGEPSGQRRTKHRHDPSVQREEEESPPSPVHEARPRRRPGKEPAASVELGRDYFGKKVELRNARNEEVYRYDKCEGLERRFWCQLHQDFYASVVLRKGKAPIVPCRYVDWAYFESLDDPLFNEAITKCKEFGLYDIMGFRYNWNEEIFAQFHSSMYYDARKIAFVWTTEGQKYEVDYMTFSRILALGSKDDEKTCIHIENQLKPNQLSGLFFNPLLAQKGNASTLQPFYYMMNQFFRATIDGKDGDGTSLRYYACNLLARTMPRGRPFCIMDFIWN
ncbi:Reverse transcriptase (RNA-dependent DNA polymerase), putative [Panicum miliaceum]|uniref:Reverse transcriptase (RNA-dependent DNA polymerase), putative n=1 Tax=Panicum miliaceum TaxID=4540 RepID=A0A3L6SKH1_PANMI|nr:Reverse transcriptase (RNA-dependent DNA polymerase), putative [Panicum miliaceum]